VPIGVFCLGLTLLIRKIEVVDVSLLHNKLKELERELNETHNLKREISEFPIDVKIPRYRAFRNSLALFYQKGRGFRAWSPNHFTRASLVTTFVPFLANNPSNPNIRSNSANNNLNNVYWNVRVGNGIGVTQKQDTALKATTTYQADSGTSARVDASTGYQRQFSAIYNAGTLPSGYGIREVGVFAIAQFIETISGQTFNQGTEYMISRFSVDDGDFAVYNVNNTLPLTVTIIYEWTLA
jgi:hypothetical protein